MVKVLKDLIDGIGDKMKELEGNSSSYSDGKSDGFNLSIRDLEGELRKIENSNGKELLKYVPEAFLNNVDKIKIMDKFRPCDKYGYMEVFIQKRGEKPLSYAVIWGGNRMDKFGQFNLEPIASSRDEEYIRDHSFTSIEEAWECFYTFYPTKGE